MKHDGTCRLALTAALLSFFLAGCATQGASSAAKAQAPVVNAVSPAVAPAAAASAAPATESAVRAATRPAQVLPPPTELEVQAGIQIVHIAATASGGLVDARFKILDTAKASALLSNAANVPQLVVGDKPPLIAPHHALKGARFGQGQIFYILYPNQRNAVAPGVSVTVAMGAMRLGPVIAQ